MGMELWKEFDWNGFMFAMGMFGAGFLVSSTIMADDYKQKYESLKVRYNELILEKRNTQNRLQHNNKFYEQEENKVVNLFK